MDLLANSSQYILPSTIGLVLVPLFTLCISLWANQVASKRNAKIEGCSKFKVKQSPLLIGSLIVSVVLCGGTSLLFTVLYLCKVPDGPSFVETLWIVCAFGVLGIISDVALFAAKRWQIAVSDEKIEFTPSFGKVKEFIWKDLACVKTRQMWCNLVFAVYLKQNKKTAFSFGTVMVGGQLLEEEFRKRGSIH